MTGSIHASHFAVVLLANSQLTTGVAAPDGSSRIRTSGSPPAHEGKSGSQLDHSLICGIRCAMIYGMTTSVEELIEAATDARRIAQKAIELAVREARAADWSWDQISAALGGKPNGETLRRNFGSGE
jgi:hypothetical protein